ncbi:hypothetical protein [Chitinophaga niabensis]|uniref:Uncharacterized conserved protein YfeS, contains WGR domain n=1 Tax=Chitinophaga niabensis TaxID=536979 RepID=A0A1N6FG71_9BACT|nr:hypothetical protein [Chitinophaga niabensis]SIN94259.1 Uncharacterized conserved protein YfeS, contains WGR domain [Chitinophaga niabensis]
MNNTYENAHIKARELFTEEFYWSPIEETSPFGNDDGADAFYQFREWRETNQTASPLIFIELLLDTWGYSRGAAPHDAEVAEYLVARSKLGINNVIIAVGFGQFVLEGKIDKDLLVRTIQSVEKECAPSRLSVFEEEYRVKRLEQLNILRKALDKMA